MQAAEKVLLPACVKAPQNPASILRPAYGFCEHLSPQFEFVWCGVVQMSAIQGSIGSLKEGVHTRGQRLQLAQEDEEQDAQELQQACASHSQAVNHVCRLQVSVFTSGGYCLAVCTCFSLIDWISDTLSMHMLLQMRIITLMVYEV